MNIEQWKADEAPLLALEYQRLLGLTPDTRWAANAIRAFSEGSGYQWDETTLGYRFPPLCLLQDLLMDAAELDTYSAERMARMLLRGGAFPFVARPPTFRLYGTDLSIRQETPTAEMPVGVGYVDDKG